MLLCAPYFASSPFNATTTVLYNWNFTILPGYNKIVLPAPISVPKGSVIMLTQYSTNSTSVAVDTSGTAEYSDLLWRKNLQNLNSVSNWRFYFTSLSNFSFYEGTIKIIHKYHSDGLYNITVILLSSNFKFTINAEVTDCKFFFFFKFNLKLIFYILSKNS